MGPYVSGEIINDYSKMSPVPLHRTHFLVFRRNGKISQTLVIFIKAVRYVGWLLLVDGRLFAVVTLLDARNMIIKGGTQRQDSWVYELELSSVTGGLFVFAVKIV